MSRVGSKLIEVPDKVKVAIADNHVEVEGPKGKLDGHARPHERF